MRFSRKTLLYLFFAFGISWTLALVYWLVKGNHASSTLPFMGLGLGFMFAPMFSVILVDTLIYKEKIQRLYPLRFRWNRWWTVAWLLPLGIGLATFGVGLLLPTVGFSWEMEGMFERFKDVMSPEQLEEMHNSPLPIHPFFLTILQGLIAGITVNALAGFGEELGWRGLLYAALKRMNFWKASFITGIIWGIWHAPMILLGHNYPDHPVEGVFMMILFCILFSPLFTLIRWKSGSVIAAAIFHGSFNAMAGIAIILLKGGSDLLIGVTGLAGLLVLCLANLLIYLLFPETIRGRLEVLDPTLTRPVDHDAS